MPRKEPRNKILDNITIDDNGCWLMRPAQYGYAVVQVYTNGKQKLVRAHRYSYQVFVGSIPEGLVICHTCDVKNCVNPEHLVAGTQKENIQDALNKGIFGACKTHCKRGHELSENNLYYMFQKGRNTTVRQCKTCWKLRDKKYREKKQAVA
jgi:hypothetical protein